MGQILQQQQQQLTQQLGLEENWIQQQAWQQRNAVELRVPKVMVHDNPKAFLESFEWVALVAGLEKSWWVRNLRVLLIGKAQVAYESMSREEARNYDKVKKEILYRLDIHPETYHQAFRAWKPREAREPHALWQCLADLVTKWLKPGESSKGEICDKILLDDLDEETQRWVCCHRPG